MANFNKVILAGNLTRDPQLSYLPSNTPVVEFGLAINRRWKSQTGEQREEVCFVDCQAFARSAEVINQYLKKGQGIMIDGRLKYDQWEGKDGQKRSRLRVVVDTFQFIGGPGGGGDSGGGRGPRTSRTPEPARTGGGHDDGPPMDDYDAGSGGDNIPF